MGIAWVFPGQGSQKVGMAEAVLELPGARERFAQASELLGRDLLAICSGSATGELADLNDTRNTQPALFVIESLLVDGLKAQGRQYSVETRIVRHHLDELGRKKLNDIAKARRTTGISYATFHNRRK